MNLKHITLATALILGSALPALANNVRTDYDHTVDFRKYTTYSWGKVKTTDPFYSSRIQQAVDTQLQAKGWKLVPTGGSVTVFATDKIHNQKEIQTHYETLGGGWGGGWGWGGWGWGGPAAPLPGGFMGDKVSSTTDQQVGDLVVDIFIGDSKKLLWRGLATDDLSTNTGKNTTMLDNDIKDMFKSFPAKPAKK